MPKQMGQADTAGDSIERVTERASDDAELRRAAEASVVVLGRPGGDGRRRWFVD